MVSVRKEEFRPSMRKILNCNFVFQLLSDCKFSLFKKTRLCMSIGLAMKGCEVRILRLEYSPGHRRECRASTITTSHILGSSVEEK